MSTDLLLLSTESQDRIRTLVEISSTDGFDLNAIQNWSCFHFKKQMVNWEMLNWETP